MIRHPSENFLKYLISTQDMRMLDNNNVNFMVTSLGFPPASDDYLTWLRGELTQRMPAQFMPSNKYHRPSMRFMRTEGIYGLHYPDDATREANLIITHLRARPIVEELLLGHIEPVIIAKKVNARLSEHFTSDGIDAYRHYYWNVSLLRVEEWAILLQNYEIQKSKTLAILQVGPTMALHQAGFQQEMESKAMLQEIQETLYFDFLQWKKQPHSMKRTQAMASIAKSVTTIDERLMESNSLLKDSLKQFEQFRMQHAKQGVKDLRTLAPDGNFTGSGAKLLEAPKEEDESAQEKTE